MFPYTKEGRAAAAAAAAASTDGSVRAGDTEEVEINNETISELHKTTSSICLSVLGSFLLAPPRIVTRVPQPNIGVLQCKCQNATSFD